MADSSSSSAKGGSRTRRAWTVSADTDLMETSSRSNTRSSIDSNTERPKTQAGETDDSSKATHGGFSKLLKARRARKKKSQRELDDVPPVPDIVLDQELEDFPSNESRSGLLPKNDSIPQEGEVINLLTDDSEPDRTPPLTSHSSHSGFATSSSPLIKTTSADNEIDGGALADVDSAISGGSDSIQGEKTLRPSRSKTNMTLDVPNDSSGKRRSPSPGRRLFSADNKKDNAGDDNTSKSSGSKSGRGLFGSRRSSLSAKRSQTNLDQPPPIPAPIRTDLTEEKPRSLQASPLPSTPPYTATKAPATTVTPPTPTEHRPPRIIMEEIMDSPEEVPSRNSISSPGITISPSGNMISHRRVRSASSTVHAPSKLSSTVNAMSPLEETKSPKSAASQQSGFFSSVFSVAQNAASSISNNFNAQQRNRATSQSTGTEVERSAIENDPEENGIISEQASKSDDGKPSTIETLGTGDLNFSHLDIDAPISTADGLVVTKPEIPAKKRNATAVQQRDEDAAKLEGKRAARAVDMAYEKPSESSAVGSPGGEDGLDIQSNHSFPSHSMIIGDQTPPTGSIVDSDLGRSGSLKRSGSVRSALRRHRGSSTASTIGAIGMNALALGIPAVNPSIPRLTGFAVASKKRNRDFHQLFRSVPEDDYLIEDYGCALQREIILAGRIYISEGHICFSSNILGWVTTLVFSFDEVVAIEKESTAMVFPNAIAIQTLHARHTFRSLLSRESTYDLMVNIWKINHPSLKSSVNGTRVTDGTGDKTEKVGEGESELDSDSSDDDDEDEIYDEDEEGDNVESFFEGGASANGSERSLPVRVLTQQSSGLSGNGTALATEKSSSGDKNGDKSGASKENDFPGPATHAPTEYGEPDGQYERVIKDEIIPAPLGKVYSLVFGPASGEFMTKFLVENQKSGELQFESTDKGLTEESPIRKYSYIKPLYGAIGPKQTKCISSENLDILDLEKAVLVTLSTQTPDVPSGNVFAVKTKYLLTWAPGNATRFLMTCNIEWSGKSWLKGPIEKGAIDGQGTFGTELTKTLKAAVIPRGRAPAAGRGKGRRKKGTSDENDVAVSASLNPSIDTSASPSQSWGLFEPVRPLLEPVTSMLKPLLGGNIAILIIVFLLYMAFFRTPSNQSMLPHEMGYPSSSLPQRLAAYEEMWRREESELWNWLEDRVGMDGMVIPTLHQMPDPSSRKKSPQFNAADQRDFVAQLREQKVSDREMNHAIRTTRQRLDILEGMMNNRKVQDAPSGEPTRSDL